MLKVIEAGALMSYGVSLTLVARADEVIE